ncbi:hypothetical protein [Streptomyces sp. NPDC096324]|uniref:hypothetical protein n=1 Tax=Streptomyces sp. NPDC096324 TaxID=3366085 RepID=UPI0038071903
MLHDHPAALAASADGPVEVWELPTLRRLRPSLTGHEATVRGVATAVVNRRHLAVTGGHDRSVRIWDLDGERETGSRLNGHVGSVTGVATAVADGSCVIITAGSDATACSPRARGGGHVGVGRIPTRSLA